jgi:hypothetical protein
VCECIRGVERREKEREGHKVEVCVFVRERGREIVSKLEEFIERVKKRRVKGRGVCVCM